MEDKLWNRHFGLTYVGMNKWEDKGSIRKKFANIYHKKDIGFFLSGAYHAVENSIDRNSNQVFLKKVSNFLLDHDQWIDTAKKKALQQIELAKNNPIIQENKQQSL